MGDCRRITSASNALYKELKRAERGKGRYGETLAVEGEEPVWDLLTTGHRAMLVAVDTKHVDAWRAGPGADGEVVTDAADAKAAADAADEIVVMDDDLLRRLAETATSPGVIAWTVWPWEAWEGSLLSEGAGRYLYLDRIQDPGNAGTLIRAAAAFGLDAVLLSPGCARGRHPKLLRASMGSVFRIPVYEEVPMDDVLREAAPPLLVADADGEPLPAFGWPPRWTLVIGHEGSGPDPALLRGAEHILSIPMPGGVESLNAAMAGSILLYAASTAEGER